MTGMQSLSCGVILLTLLPIYIHAAVSLSFRTKPGPLNYVRLGNTLRLSVSYDFNGTDTITVAWEYGGSAKVQKVGNNPPQIGDPRATFEGQASLVLKNTTLNDNITFTVRISSLGLGTPPIQSSFRVIITVKPDALTDCNETTEVNQGGNVGCRCYSTKGNPTPTASWYKDGSLIGGVGISETRLSLNNIVIKDNGTYTCQLQSYNLKSETFVHVFVKFAPENVEIKSDKKNNIAALGKEVIIKCVANGYPTPTYTISLNGTKNLTGVVDGVKTIEEASYEDAGLCTCVAQNNLGKSSSSFTLWVQAVLTTHPTTPSVQITNTERAVLTTHPTTPSAQITNTEREKIICDKSGSSRTEWYLFFITFICGMVVGMMLLYAIMWLRLQLSKKGDHSKPSQPEAVAGPSGEGLENASAYQELDLRNMNKDYDNYQSLKMTSRNAQSNTAPVEIENEAGYQELNEVRGNTDDNYQSLNRV